jgi:ANTAR domain/GAF domain
VADLGGVTRALLAITRDLPDDRALAKQICGAVVAGLDIDGAAISLRTADMQRETLFASDATAHLLEELQFDLGEGPCVEASCTGRPVLAPDLGDTTETSRWPIYAAAATERTAVRAVFALPLQWATVKLGVLDLHRAASGSLSRAQLSDALSAADTIALMLLGLRGEPDDEQSWTELWGPRAEIHQATGMVLAQLGINPADALARLRAYAFAGQRPLVDVARDVVARRLRFTDET